MKKIVISPVAGLACLYAATWCFWFSQSLASALGIALCTSPILIWLSLIDLERHEIPDLASASLAFVGFFSVGLQNPALLPTHFLAGLIVCAILWLLGELFYRWRGNEGLGIGDAKLIGAAIVLLGPKQLPDLLLLATLGGICAIIIGQTKNEQPQQGIPFGPFIAYATFVLVLQPSIVFEDYS